MIKMKIIFFSLSSYSPLKDAIQQVTKKLMSDTISDQRKREEEQKSYLTNTSTDPLAQICATPFPKLAGNYDEKATRWL